MDAHLSFNLDDPVDMKEYGHAPKGYRYFLILEEFIKTLSMDYNDGADQILVKRYAIVLHRLASKHNMSELRSMIKSNFKGADDDTYSGY